MTPRRLWVPIALGCWLAACDPGRAPNATPLLAESTLSSPRPAQTLLLRLGGGGLGDSIHAQGVIRGTPVIIDQDEGDPLLNPFLIRGFDADLELVYETSRREPIQIREYLAALDLGFDLFLAAPQLGDFAVHLPTDLGIETVRFARRESDGTETPIAEISLAEVSDEEPPAHEVVQIQGDADPSHALDIVILGDGYREEELEAFRTRADDIVEAFLATSPYQEHAERLNFYRIDIASEESGASYDCSSSDEVEGCVDRFRDNAFGSIFPLRLAELTGREGLWDVVMFQLNQWAVSRAASVAPYDAVIVLVNTPKFGGFGLYHASLTALDSDTPNGVIHEFGHAFGLLADEYTNDDSPCQQYELTPENANMTSVTSVASEVKWSDWLTPDVPLPTPNDYEDEDAIGLFRGVGGGCTDLYKPRQHCMMRRWGEAACPICAQQLVRRIFEVSDPITNDDVELEDGRLRIESPSDLDVELVLERNEETIEMPEDGIELTPPESPPYEATYRVRARLSSPFIRTETDSLADVGEIRITW